MTDRLTTLTAAANATPYHASLGIRVEELTPDRARLRIPYADAIIVTGLARDAAKLELAKALGADHVIDVENENANRRVKEVTNGRGADVVVEVSANSPVPVAEALHYAAFGGRIVLAGMKGFKAVPDFVSDLVVVKELHILGAFGVTSPSYRAAIRLIESGRVPVERMHTHDFALEDAERAIQMLAGEVPGEHSVHSCLVPSLRARETGAQA